MSDQQTSLSQSDTAHAGGPAGTSDGRQAFGLSSSLRAILLTSPLLDELTFGILVLALPFMRDEFHLSYEQTGFLFTVGSLSAMVIEPVINLLSDRHSKRLFIVLGMLSLVMSFLLTSATSSYGMLLLAFALIFPGIGIALDLAQATLIDAAPDASSHTMTRWTIMAGIGDLLAPLAVGIITAAGLSWRVLCLFAAALWGGAAATVWPQRFPKRPTLAQHDGEEDEGSIWKQLALAFTEGLQDKTLLRWAGVVLLCTMLDEVFLAFMGLYLRDALHATGWEIGLALGGLLGGGMVGLVILDRMHAWLRRRGSKMQSERLLLWLAVFTLVNIPIILIAHNIWIVTLALVFIGAGVAGWYPLAKASAYDLRPGRTGVVRAVITIGSPFEMVLPTIVGIIAGHIGIAAGIAFLGLAPLGVLVLTPRRHGSSSVTAGGNNGSVDEGGV
ncbi:MAG TPA: MFS transporter [Ktedonobacterales bacterium]